MRRKDLSSSQIKQTPKRRKFFTSLRVRPRKSENRIFSGEKYNFYQMKDVHYEMIEKYPLGINIGPYDMNVVENITRFCHEMKDKRLSFEEVEALFPENTLTNQLAVLESLINEQLKS